MNQETDQSDMQARRRLEAGQGYLILGMEEDARAELASVTLDDLGEPGEIALWTAMNLELDVRSKDWESGAARAAMLRELAPDNPGGFIQGAYCLHELGRTDEALALLLNGPGSLREEPLFHYNLGCYHARLGDRGRALTCLREAFSRDPTLRRSAVADPDLKGLGI